MEGKTVKNVDVVKKKTDVAAGYKNIASYIGEWVSGQNKQRLLGNIHRNLIGIDKMGKIRPMEDLAYFLLICQQYGLNPLKKEIYPVYQNVKVGNAWQEKLEPIVSIHGLRTLARRAQNPTYAYTGKAQIEEDENGKVTSATVEVFGRFGKNSTEIVKVGEYTAYLEEFQKTHKEDDKYGKYKKGDPSGNWNVMPRVMLIKCAEANAIRSAFDIGGVYIEEEIGTGDTLNVEEVGE